MKRQMLSATLAASLKPSRNRVHDLGQRGLCLLVSETQTGITRTWLHRFRFGNSDTLLTVGNFPETSLEQARSTVRAQRELLTQGIDPRRGPQGHQVPIPDLVRDPRPIHPIAARLGRLSRDEDTGIVYCIGFNHTPDLVKIGISRHDASSRIKGASTMLPWDLIVHYQTPPTTKFYMLEKLAHARLKDYRIKGEWFKVDAQVAVNLLRSLATG